MRTFAIISLSTLALACAAKSTENTDQGDQADTAGIAEGTPDALGILRVANESTLDVLEKGVGLRQNAAEAIMAVRAGDDEQLGTADDVMFKTLAQLDAVPFVGPVQFRQLAAYARANGFVNAPKPPCTFESAFKAKYGQDWTPDDVSFVGTDGIERRGVGQLSIASWDTPVPYAGGVAVREIRLLGTHVYTVLASKTDARYLKALGHATYVQGWNADWSHHWVEQTLLFQLTMDEPTTNQLVAQFRALAELAAEQAPSNRVAAFRQAAEYFAQRIEAGPDTLENGSADSLGKSSNQYAAGDGQYFVFNYDTLWGDVPGLGVSVPGWSTWVNIWPTAKCDGCRAGSYVGKNYLACETPKTWVDAEKACVASGGHLATITDRAQEGFLRSLTQNGDTWIGLNDRDLAGTFAWVDEHPVQYIDWFPGEPNNSGGGEHCVQFVDNVYWGTSTQRAAARWNDTACEGNRAYLCELP